ncbi:dihydrodipicolinate synthase family protein [Cohaesibacter celericrescens]|uniref:Dihydrodipicolinate synthase family protein n=1 Tax=Cohaesibacter celericrescens TaxID=2067669 RepID=A0A2N5XXJ5_9HYPH|nr:dihydrodipicolinate synthase family protein [Cohaesibacter celericrescens]PLW79221.1 dihydrodipicolinate synthase family protein [Cohaesibacter celericrescens]
MTQSSMPFVALVTSFDADEEIDYAAVRKQVRRQVDAGNNILCCGTNGDFSSLLFEEKVKLSAEVLSAAKGEQKVFVNVGAPSTYETLKLSKEISALGVDALAVITPYFIACTQEGLYRHYCQIADAVEVPVYLYDIPARTQNHIEPETARRLADHGNIAGIKDSGGTQKTLDEYLAISRENPNFDVYSGPDSLVLYALKNGAKGCVSGLANTNSVLIKQICDAFDAGDMATAEKAQAAFTELRADLYGFGYPPAMVKRALYLMDNSVGASRQPALIPDTKLDVQITEVLKKHGLLETKGA